VPATAGRPGRYVPSPTLAPVDVDSFVAAHSAQWRRLDELSARRRLSGPEADELIELYQLTATHLSTVQSRTPDAALTARLSRTLARARVAAIGGGQRNGWAALAHGVTVDFPVTVYLTWRWWVSTALASLGLAAAMMLYIKDHPAKLTQVVSSDQVRQLVDHDFSDYYRAHPAQSFAAQVWTNNAVVAALAIFLGVTVVGTLWALAENVINLGVVGGAMLGAGKANVFFGLILPHGILELTAVFIAGGVGLRTGWAWIAPGPLPRARSLAQAGRASAVVAVGLVGVLFVSGVIEAFVTPSGLPTAARISIGGLAEAAFLTYVIVLGRRGVRAGATGDVDASIRGDLVPVA
jgi:uncharacterized membrane protein SpoIIM required for sporulation